MLLTSSQLRLLWSWTDTAGISDVSDEARIEERLAIDDSAICNVAWSDVRILSGGLIDAIDIGSLPFLRMGIGGEVAINRVHKVYIANRSSFEGSEIRVGTPSNLTAAHYAISIAGESFVYLYSREGWVASDLLRIANPTASGIEYGIALLGSGEIINA
jgi:hypothetical protein